MEEHNTGIVEQHSPFKAESQVTVGMCSSSGFDGSDCKVSSLGESVPPQLTVTPFIHRPGDQSINFDPSSTRHTSHSNPTLPLFHIDTSLRIILKAFVECPFAVPQVYSGKGIKVRTDLPG